MGTRYKDKERRRITMFFCKHKSTKGKCNAFLNGIPKEIKENFFIHTEPYEGDNAICFEARKEEYKDINFKAMRIQSIEEIIATSKKLKDNKD